MLPPPEAPELPGHLDPGRPLDEAVAATLRCPGRWGWAAASPFLALLVILLVLPLVVWAAGLPAEGDVTQAYNVVAELLLAAAVLAVAGRLARGCGGWGVALGLDRPRRGDGRRVLVWFLLQLAVRFAVAVVLHVIAPHLEPGGNLGDVDDLGPGGVVMLMLVAVLLAPVVEEIAFRGLLLRGLMRRLPFWPAAALSSFLFALLHVPGADSLDGALQVAALIYAFSLVQCELVRRTARLAPAIGVHAATNLLSTTLALATS